MSQVVGSDTDEDSIEEETLTCHFLIEEEKLDY